MSESEVKKRRHYRRTQLSICRLQVSANGAKWRKADLEDLSAGGVKFHLDGAQFESSEIYLKIDVMSGLSEFTFKTKATIVRRDGANIYAVKFVEFSKLNQVMLDEIINASNRRFDNI